MELEAELQQLAVGMGTDLFGIANLSPVQEAIAKLWEEEAAQFPRAISVRIAIDTCSHSDMVFHNEDSS